VNDVIAEMARTQSRQVAEKIEQALIKTNRVVLIRPDGSKIVYDVPLWRRHPVRRFKIFWLRRHRIKIEQTEMADYNAVPARRNCGVRRSSTEAATGGLHFHFPGCG
jgi:hypothetical protein